MLPDPTTIAYCDYAWQNQRLTGVQPNLVSGGTLPPIEQITYELLEWCLRIEERNRRRA